jgi:hypothetical protein
VPGEFFFCHDAAQIFHSREQDKCGSLVVERQCVAGGQVLGGLIFAGAAA